MLEGASKVAHSPCLELPSCYCFRNGNTLFSSHRNGRRLNADSPYSSSGINAGGCKVAHSPSSELPSFLPATVSETKTLCFPYIWHPVVVVKDSWHPVNNLKSCGHHYDYPLAYPIPSQHGLKLWPTHRLISRSISSCFRYIYFRILILSSV